MLPAFRIAAPFGDSVGSAEGSVVLLPPTGPAFEVDRRTLAVLVDVLTVPGTAVEVPMGATAEVGKVTEVTVVEVLVETME